MKSVKMEPCFTVFDKLVGKEFSIQSEDQLVRLKLTEVTRLPTATTRTDLCIRQDPFSLLFNEVTNLKPEQATYTVRTEVGTVDMFLVPVGFGEYQAIFN